MNFQPEQSEVKGCYFQVCASQNEGLPSVYDRVQNLRPAMPPLLLLRQNDELNHSSVNGSASCTSETVPSFWDAATHIVLFGEPLCFCHIFMSQVAHTSLPVLMNIFLNYVNSQCPSTWWFYIIQDILPKSHRYSTYCHTYNKWT